MTPLVLIFATFMTSFISGLFAVAGGTILMGVYSYLLPISMAMILHGVAQAFSNGFRSWFFREYICWGLIPGYIFGALCAAGLLFWIYFIPDKTFVFLFLGSISILATSLPNVPFFQIDRPYMSIVCGFFIAVTQLMCGVSGPMLDLFFIDTKLDRYEVVATKSFTQMLSHLIKLLYYSSFLGLSIQDEFTLPYWILPSIILATFLGAKPGKYLLQYINEEQFRRITRHLIMLLGIFYVYLGLKDFLT